MYDTDVLNLLQQLKTPTSRRRVSSISPEGLTPLTEEEAARVRLLLVDDPMLDDDPLGEDLMTDPDDLDGDMAPAPPTGPGKTSWVGAPAAAEEIKTPVETGVWGPPPAVPLAPAEGEPPPLPRRAEPAPPVEPVLCGSVTVELDEGMWLYMKRQMEALRQSPAIRATGMPVTPAVVIRALLLEASRNTPIDWGIPIDRPVPMVYDGPIDTAQGSGSVRQQKSSPLQTSHADPRPLAAGDTAGLPAYDLPACLASAADLGWQPWPETSPVPADQRVVHQQYTSKHWVRMFALRTPPSDDPNERKFRVESDVVSRSSVPANMLIWYWCPRSEPVRDYDQIDPDSAAATALMPPGMVISNNERGADVNGTPVERAILPLGIADILRPNWCV